MTEEFTTVGEISLCYESFGSVDDQLLVLVTGLGGQLVHWPAEFCTQLAGRGFRVVRFDNRDSGRSTVLSSLPTPGALPLLLGSGRGAAYGLDDMAADIAGLIGNLGAPNAHIVGVSLGGILGQVLTVQEPAVVRSLTAISSNTGRSGDHPNVLMRAGMLMPPARSREKYQSQAVRGARLTGSPGFPFPTEEVERTAGIVFDRGVHPAGSRRQLAAIFAAGDRTPQVRAIAVPTLAIHGESDRVIPASGSAALVGSVDDARLMLVPGMGHDLPAPVWPRMIDAIVANASR